MQEITTDMLGELFEKIAQLKKEIASVPTDLQGDLAIIIE